MQPFLDYAFTEHAKDNNGMDINNLRAEKKEVWEESRFPNNNAPRAISTYSGN